MSDTSPFDREWMKRETGNYKFLGALIKYINFLFSINFSSDSVYWNAVSIDSYLTVVSKHMQLLILDYLNYEALLSCGPVNGN